MPIIPYDITYCLWLLPLTNPQLVQNYRKHWQLVLGSFSCSALDPKRLKQFHCFLTGSALGIFVLLSSSFVNYFWDYIYDRYVIFFFRMQCLFLGIGIIIVLQMSWEVSCIRDMKESECLKKFISWATWDRHLMCRKFWTKFPVCIYQEIMYNANFLIGEGVLSGNDPNALYTFMKFSKKNTHNKNKIIYICHTK